MPHTPSVPPILENELGRLSSLARLRILDTAPEDSFDEVTRLAKDHFGVQIALVSLVDDERQWFKSRCGVDARETPRSVAFCAHAIMDDVVFEVPDARDDARFRDNPLVTGAPFIRFYAGAPVHAPNGDRMGTVCIIDAQPRRLDPSQRRALQDLARIVDTFLLARWEAARADQDRARLDRVLHALSHDLRTPIRHAVQSMQLLETAAPDDPDREELWGIARRAVRHLEDQQAGLLQLNRALTDGPMMPMLAEWACEKAWSCVPGRRDAILDVGELPEVPSRDPGIEEVFLPLLSNAVRHGGSPHPRVTVRAAPDAAGWRFTVHDDGAGLPPDVDEFVFRPLARLPADLPTRGVGLAIVRMLVEAMGGEAGFEPRLPGHGTTAWFTWPPMPRVLRGDDRP